MSSPRTEPAEPIQGLLDDERGQSTTEWAILAAFLLIALWATFLYFPEVMGKFFRGLAGLLLLPVP